jgi:hypothetical protein
MNSKPNAHGRGITKPQRATMARVREESANAAGF